MHVDRQTDACTAATPVVSVIVLTYNHERLIADALRSVCAQVEAPVHEVLVAEDYSTDRTQAAIQSLQPQFPGRFQLLDRGRNLGLSANLEDAWRRCRGRYICILEGDDVWIDPHKLAKVTAAMDAHPEWCGCFHAVRVRSEFGEPSNPVLPHPFPEQAVEFSDLLRRNWIPTYSCVTYRRGLVTEFPEWHRRLACGDWGLNLLHAEHGSFGFLPSEMTQYLVHGSGMWSGMGEVSRWLQSLLLWESIDRHYAGRYSELIRESREAFLQSCQRSLEDLRKIERRYHQLQLDHLASGARWLKQVAQRWLGRKPG